MIDRLKRAQELERQARRLPWSEAMRLREMAKNQREGVNPYLLSGDELARTEAARKKY